MAPWIRFWGTIAATRNNNSRILPARSGFQLEALLSFNRFGSPAWWLNGRVLRRKSFGLWQIKMLNFLTPMVRMIDRFLPFPPLSIIAILRKPPSEPSHDLASSSRPESRHCTVRRSEHGSARFNFGRERGLAVASVRSHLLILAFVFVVTLPLVNPLVHGDGVGYYAYLRAPIIQHNFRFEEDWRHANLSFAESRLNPDNQLRPDQYTSTGHISNLFHHRSRNSLDTILPDGSSGGSLADRFGSHIPADGFSLPYRVLVAFGTAFYGFCGLLLSYLLARKFLDPACALLATLGVWAGSSLPVYMYFNPFWSHAHSAFVVALFLWYWDRTRPDRTVGQWLLLGLISGLLVDVYFVNGVFLLIPLVESIQGLRERPSSKRCCRGSAPIRREPDLSCGLWNRDRADALDAQDYFWRDAAIRRLYGIAVELASSVLAFTSCFLPITDC